MNKHLEIKTIDHKGIKVTVKLDYENGTASLIEILNAHGGMQTPAKKWVFADRTLDYMNGWLLILQAMTVAVQQCKADLEADLAQKSAFKEKKIERVLRGIANAELEQNIKSNKKKK